MTNSHLNFEKKMSFLKKFSELPEITPKNDLEKYFLKNDKRLIHKWFHYFEIYDIFFSKFRGKEVSILEIGVDNGGSLQMWKEYFGPNAKIYGVDIVAECKQFEEEQIKILIGSQEDANFWDNVKTLLPKFDIIIDDGGHSMNQQIKTYECMFSHLNDGGIYLCEDTHTSYLEPNYWGGGYKNPNSFIEYSKNLIDYIHSWYNSEMSHHDDPKNIFGIHYYDSILVLEKRVISKPWDTTTGKIFTFERGL